MTPDQWRAAADGSDACADLVAFLAKNAHAPDAVAGHRNAKTARYIAAQLDPPAPPPAPPPTPPPPPVPPPAPPPAPPPSTGTDWWRQGGPGPTGPKASLGPVQVKQGVRMNGGSLRNFTAYGILQQGDPIVLEDGLVKPPSGWGDLADGVAYSNYTARRVEVTGTFDAFKAHGDVTIEDCWVHDCAGQAGGGNTGGGYPHVDGVQSSGGSHITIRRSRFENISGNGGIYLDPEGGRITDVLIEDCYLNRCGNFNLFCIATKGANNEIRGVIDRLTVRNVILGESYSTADWAGLAWINATNVTWENVRTTDGRAIPYRTGDFGPRMKIKIGP